MKYLIGLFLIILMLLVGCASSNSFELNEPVGDSPILMVEFSYDWRWQCGDYHDAVQSFLARGDVRVIAIEHSYRSGSAIEATIIFYQKEQ